MFAAVDSKPPSSVHAEQMDSQDDAALDLLPFGVIGLDREGTILRYNQYESRLARLDKNQVLGRSFFTEVAPCTKTAEFEGRFKAFTAGEGAASARFPYTFDFTFGAQDVEVEITRVPGRDRYYLLINRKALGPARPPGVARAPAALQRALAPDEEALGVRRDNGERRYVAADATLLAALRTTCNRLAPETWQIFCQEWGVQWGRRAAIDMEISALEQGQTGLRDMPMRAFADLFAARAEREGWGSMTIDAAFMREGLLAMDLRRSVLAETAPLATTPGGGDLSCHLFAGLLAGLLSHAAGRKLTAREVACRASGADACAFVAVGDARKADLDAALSAGIRGKADIAAALRRKHRGGGQ